MGTICKAAREREQSQAQDHSSSRIAFRREETVMETGRRPIRRDGIIGPALLRSRVRGLVLLLATLPVSGLHAAGPPRRASKNQTDLASYDALITSEDREHWAFQTLELPQMPEVKQTTWARNPIDRFVVAGLERQDWTPVQPAEPHALDAPVVPRRDRLAPLARRTGRVSGGLHSRPRRGRAMGRQIARPSRLRRTLGTLLAGSRPIRRIQRLRARRHQTFCLALSRLRDPRLQCRQALQPVRDRAVGRR